MWTKYLLRTGNSHLDQDFSPTRIFTSHMVELEHLDETRQKVVDRTSTR
jgi:hypothetical protein